MTFRPIIASSVLPESHIIISKYTTQNSIISQIIFTIHAIIFSSIDTKQHPSCRALNQPTRYEEQILRLSALNFLKYIYNTPPRAEVGLSKELKL